MFTWFCSCKRNAKQIELIHVKLMQSAQKASNVNDSRLIDYSRKWTSDKIAMAIIEVDWTQTHARTHALIQNMSVYLHLTWIQTISMMEEDIKPSTVCGKFCFLRLFRTLRYFMLDTHIFHTRHHHLSAALSLSLSHYSVAIFISYPHLNSRPIPEIHNFGSASLSFPYTIRMNCSLSRPVLNVCVHN